LGDYLEAWDPLCGGPAQCLNKCTEVHEELTTEETEWAKEIFVWYYKQCVSARGFTNHDVPVPMEDEDEGSDSSKDESEPMDEEEVAIVLKPLPSKFGLATCNWR